MRRFALLGTLSFTLGLLLASNAPALGLRAQGIGKPDVAHSGPNVGAMTLTGNRAALRVLLAPNTNCAGADDSDASVGLQESAMACLLNYARQQAGMPRLNPLGKLDGSATNKAADILRCNDFGHEACGRDFLYWVRRTGYLNSRCWSVGENLAWGTGGLGSARAIMNAWLHSPSHRANLLSPDFSQFGLSLRVGGLDGASDAHVWVNHFGRHC